MPGSISGPSAHARASTRQRLGTLAAEIGAGARPRRGRRRSRRGRARKSIAVASATSDARGLGHRVAEHAADDIGEIGVASQVRAEVQLVGHRRVVHRRVVPHDRRGGRRAPSVQPRASSARSCGEHTVGPVHITSTSGGSPAPSSARYGDGWVPTYSVGHSVSEASARVRRSSAKSQVASRPGGARGPAASGCRRAATGTTDTPASRSGSSLREQRRAVGRRLVVDVETGRDREPEPGAVRLRVRGELAEAATLVRRRTARASRPGAWRRPWARTRTRSCRAARGTRSRRAGLVRPRRARRNPRRRRARRTRPIGERRSAAPTLIRRATSCRRVARYAPAPVTGG